MMCACGAYETQAGVGTFEELNNKVVMDREIVRGRLRLPAEPQRVELGRGDPQLTQTSVDHVLGRPLPDIETRPGTQGAGCGGVLRDQLLVHIEVLRFVVGTRTGAGRSAVKRCL